jgi:hypothetical protein
MWLMQWRVSLVGETRIVYFLVVVWWRQGHEIYARPANFISHPTGLDEGVTLKQLKRDLFLTSAFMSEDKSSHLCACIE